MPVEIKEPTPRLSCLLSEIDDTDLLRSDVGDLTELTDSIRENLDQGLPALIHPVVLDSKMKLVSGYRRLCAHRELKLTHIDYTLIGVLDDATRVRLEVSANYQKRFNWKETVLGIDKFHTFHSTQAALKGSSWGVRETGRLLSTSKSNINRATFIAKYLRAGDPEVSKAENIQDAYRVLAARREAELAAALVKSTAIPTGAGQTLCGVPVVRKEVVPVSDEDFFSSMDSSTGTTGFTPGIGSPVDLDERPGGGLQAGISTAAGPVVIPLSRMFVHADAVAHTQTLPAEAFDAVITDWPYGIDMDNIQQDGGGKDVSATAAEHDVADNLSLQYNIIPELYRVLKPNGWFITWTDISVWESNWKRLIDCDFKVQRWPLIWHKTSTCQNMAAQYNFTKNYEIAIVARKGASALLRPQSSSVWTGGNDAETRLLGHPFAKPAGLWEWLYNATCLRGARVYDPFVGSGSSTLPAIRLGLRPEGCETKAEHFNTLNVNLQNFYRSLDPNCQFS